MHQTTSSNYQKNWQSIAGLSVLFMNPAHSGRVASRGQSKPREKGFVQNDSENPYLSIKRVYEVVENKRRQEETLREKGASFGEEQSYLVQTRQLRKEIEQSQTDLVRQLKMNFKHIVGMAEARNKNAFMSEVERYETVEVENLINKKIIRPAKNVIECMHGVKGLFAQHEELDRYLRNFKQPQKKVVVEKRQQVLEPIRFDPALDMGNIYQGYCKKLNDPIL